MADGVWELARCGELLKLVPEVRAEQLVHRREHLRPRAVVLRQRQQLRGSYAALAEDGDVGMAEAVDRLEFVPDEKELSCRPAQQIHEVALQAIRVLELVDHDRAEPPLLALADQLVVAQQVARRELEILEVDRRLLSLRGRVCIRKAIEEILEQR